MDLVNQNRLWVALRDPLGDGDGDLEWLGQGRSYQERSWFAWNRDVGAGISSDHMEWFERL